MTPEATPQSPQIVTPEARIRTVVGVWLVPITPEGKIFVVRNKAAKFESQKVPGQLNCPAETYKPLEDLGSFKIGTIPRAIEEEIGGLDYDPSEVKSLPFINLLGLGKKVVAAPYLIPVSQENCYKFNPRDPNESDSPHWVYPKEISSQKTLQVGPFQVPLFRSPMEQIAKMILDPSTRSRIWHCHPTIGREVFDFLQQNQRNIVVPDSLPTRTVPRLVLENPPII